jgi:hypothetical protein
MGIETDRRVATEPATPGGPVFWAAVAIGWALMAFGVVGAFDNAQDSHPRSLTIWIVGCLAVHDLLIAPAVFAIGGALRRALAPPIRAIVQGALIVSAVIVIVSIPVVGRFGVTTDNPSALPRNYTAGALGALVVVWIATAAVLVVAWRRSRHT